MRFDEQDTQNAVHNQSNRVAAYSEIFSALLSELPDLLTILNEALCQNVLNERLQREETPKSVKFRGEPEVVR